MQRNASTIENAFYDAYGPRWVSTIYASVNEYKVLLELEPQISGRPARAVAALLQDLERQADPARHAGRASQQDTGPQTINHYGQLPAATVSFNLQARRTRWATWYRRSRRLRGPDLPATISTNFQGAAKAFQSSLGNLWVLLIIAIMVVYIVLGHSVRELHPPA